MARAPELYLGTCSPIEHPDQSNLCCLPAHHLLTHTVVVGMTGSGKSGLLTVMVEEALSSHVPVLMIDIKGDLPNLLLGFPGFDAKSIEPWVEPTPGDDCDPETLAVQAASERETALRAWGIREQHLRDYNQHTEIRVITPGSNAGEPLHVLSALERPASDWEKDPTSARASLAAAVSLVLRLLGRDPDPARSKEHVLLSVLAEERGKRGEPSRLEDLLADVTKPPIETVGALPIDRFVSKRDRAELAAALNALLASPSFATWREGVALDVGSWLTPRNGRTPGVIVSVAHLDDEERALVLGVVLEEVVTWLRHQGGSKRLRALVVFDEVYGYLPPHPANPPTKRPLVTLMKQARAYGVGIVVATQNPMDLDYRALSNAGLWCVGRLQTDADRARVVEGLALNNGHEGTTTAQLSELTKSLAPRWFVLRDVHAAEPTRLLQPRWAMSFLHGPMTPEDIRRARAKPLRR
jgi:DNA helicase HerA-like ATPase